jgi:hypothetical protein
MNRREYYRIPYPVTERPRLVLGTAIHEVLDCSETGIRFEADDPASLQVGAPVQGRLRLRCGADLRVQGEVLRQDGEVVTASLDAAGVPLGTILKEQYHLRAVARAQG